MPILASIDWLIFLLFLFCSFAIGLSMRSSIKSSEDFLQAGRALPAWVCALAFFAASLGSDAVLAAGAAGAKYGLRAGVFFSIGAAGALLLVAQFMMPAWYGSGARTLPEYLGQRFDQKTRLLSACMFVLMALLTAGISLALLARLLRALRIFDPLFFAFGYPRELISNFCFVLFAIVVLLYVFFAGLAGAMVNQALQFALLIAGFLPIVWIGLGNIGGWDGFNAAMTAAAGQGFVHSGGASVAVCAFALGLSFGAIRWATDFRVVQPAMAAKNAVAAHRIPLIGAAVWLLIPLLLVLPGAIAIGSPTPQSRTVIRNENGAIYHEITVVPRANAEGRGLVPARLDPATQNALRNTGGHPLLDYAMATPNLLVRTLPTGLLGLGLSALLAALMTTLATSVTAVNAVFTRDIYQTAMRKSAGDQQSLRVARWTTVAGTLVIVGLAFAFYGLDGSVAGGLGLRLLGAALLVFSILQSPQLATFLLARLSRPTNAAGAFAGLAAGTVASTLHYGLTLPQGCLPGIRGGWITPAWHYPSFVAQCLGTSIAALIANTVLAVLAGRAKR